MLMTDKLRDDGRTSEINGPEHLKCDRTSVYFPRVERVRPFSRRGANKIYIIIKSP